MLFLHTIFPEVIAVIVYVVDAAALHQYLLLLELFVYWLRWIHYYSGVTTLNIWVYGVLLNGIHSTSEVVITLVFHLFLTLLANLSPTNFATVTTSFAFS